MKKVFIQILQPDPDGPSFARVITTADQMAIQDFMADRTTRTIKDLLMAGATVAQVAGFGATLTAGLGVSIAAGDVVDVSGMSYELDAAVEKILGAADPANPRIDLIYGTLSIDADAETELRPFLRLRTQAELEAQSPQYPPVQFNVPTEKHTKVTINVRAGTPAGVPVAPAAGDGEVPLWQVHVAAGQTVLAGGDLTDVRVLMKSLYQASTDVAGKVNKSGDTMTGPLNIVALLKVVWDVAFTDTTVNIPRVVAGADQNKQLGFGYDDGNDVAFIQARRIGTGVKKLLINPLGGLVGIGTSAVPSGTNKSLAVGGGVSIGSGVQTTNVPANGLITEGHATFGDSTNHSTLQTGGSFAAKYLSETSVSFSPSDDNFSVEMAADNSAYQLPDASTCAGRIYVVKFKTAVNQQVIPFGAQTVEGAAGFTATVAKQVRWFQSNGVNDWRIIGGYL